jgi:hypothetical protein
VSAAFSLIIAVSAKRVKWVERFFWDFFWGRFFGAIRGPSDLAAGFIQIATGVYLLNRV